MSCMFGCVPMSKNRAGFSYIEVLIAMALFAVALVAVLPTLLQAGRNMEYAESHYIGHYTAHEIMLTVRDALIDGSNLEDAILTKAVLRNVSYYRVWLRGVYNVDIYSPNAPEASILDPLNEIAPLSGHNSTIIIAIWNSNRNLMGRAIGVVNHSLGEPYD